MSDDVLEKRKESLLNFFKNKKFILVYISLIIIIISGYNIRTNNLKVLGGYLADPDAHVFLRYAKYIVEYGTMPDPDTYRYYPLGFHPKAEFGFLSYFIAYLYKFLHIFNSSLTIETVDLIFPAIAFIFGIIFFFLLIRRLFDYRIALLASLCLTIVPAFLFRTISGVSDKEALAMPLMFLSLYLFVAAWQSKKILWAFVLAILAGISTGFTALTWGGVVYVLVAVGGFAFFESLLQKFTKRDFLVYSLWTFFTLFLMVSLGKGRFSISTLASSLTTGIILFSFLFSLINFLVHDRNVFKLKDRLYKINLPKGSINLMISLIIIILITSIIYGPLFIFQVLSGNLDELFNPQQNNRWSITVAENHQVYVSNWFGDFSKLFVWIFIIASIFLFYEMAKTIHKYKWKLTIVYTLFIMGLIFSRYSPNSKLNGESFLSHAVLFLSIFMFIAYMVYLYIFSYYKDKKSFEEMMNIDKKYSLIFIWFLFGVIGAKTSIRLIFPFAPITSFLFAYFVFILIDHIKNSERLKSKTTKIIGYVVIGIIAFYILSGFMKTTVANSKAIGPIYSQQWQEAGNWVKSNTPKNSVFVHWWDYGYLIQTGFDRPTVTDGGNAIGPWNYYVGRLVLTAQNETEPLSFLKTHDVSYLLIVSDDIGKYPAYSSIGSDENYDRYSWIGTYVLSPQLQETRNSTILLYQGGVGLDEDFIYQNQLFPRQSAGIAGFFLPLEKEGNNTNIAQPTAAIISNNKRYDVPLECVFINDKEITFENKGLAGCLRIIPSIDEKNNINPFGAALYLSPRVRRTLFAKLYIYGQDSDIFKLVYSDDTKGAPLVLWRNRLVGPLRIWKINYPSDVKTDFIYLGTSFINPNVTYVKKGY